MQLEFLESKDGSKTFSADGLFYHSSYSPLKEARRFIETYDFVNNPKIVFLIEPGFNYFSDCIKERFTGCKVACIRFFDHHFDDENTWDYVLRYDGAQKFSQVLLNTFGEETLLCSALLVWKPAETLFKEKLGSFINEYKEALQASKTLLVTRQFFEQKWLINSCNFIKYTKRLIKPFDKTTLPVVVCASGPSLLSAVQTIKQFEQKLFIICLSSALSVLIKNEITPDLVLSTDGGFWAGEHLKYLKNNPGIPLAASCEAFVPKKILKENPVCALQYNDSSSFISSMILEKAGIKSFEALRNPTVSGTGLFFAKSITTNKVFFCGLDLAQSEGFEHSQPNELEKNNELNDLRISTKETRLSRSRYNASSLQIYRDWFCSLDSKDVQNVLRIIDKHSQDALGNIKDIAPEEFKNELTCTGETKKVSDYQEQTLNETTLSDSFMFIIEQLKTDKWMNQIFPADFLSIQNAPETEKPALQNRLNKKVEKLTARIRKIADE